MGQKHIGQDRAAECTSQQAAFRMLMSILAAAACIPVIPGLGENIGSGFSVLSATGEIWAQICNEQLSFRLECAGLYRYSTFKVRIHVFSFLRSSRWHWW